MANNRDDFLKPVINQLRELAGHTCSNPDCRVITQGPNGSQDKTISIGVAAHIVAAAAKGPRADSELTPEQRSHYDNGIWLCQSCSRLIDVDAERYPVELLQQWKVDAVERAKQHIGKSVVLKESVINGYTIKQHESKLIAEKAALRQDLEKIHSGEKQVLALEKQLLERQITDVENQLTHLHDSYQTRITFLESTIKELRTLAEDLPNDELLVEAEAQLRQGNSAKADELFKQIEAQQQAIIAKAEKASQRAAKAAFERGKIAQANLDYYAAYDHFERAVGYAPENALYLNEAGTLANILAKYSQQLIWQEKALAIYVQQQGEDSSEVATLTNNLGATYKDLGQYDKAIEYYQQALESDLNTYGQEHPNVATMRNNLGMAYHALGQYDKAIAYFQQALASDLNTYGDDHPDVAIDRNNLGMAYHALGQYDKAIEYYQQALASDLNTYGQDHPDVARDRNNLAGAYKALGQYDKAIAYFQQALAIFEGTFDAEHPSVKTVKDNLASAQAEFKQS